MRPPGERGEHAAGVFGIGRFAEGPPVQRHERVRRYDDGVVKTGADSVGLSHAQEPDHVTRRGRHVFVDV